MNKCIININLIFHIGYHYYMTAQGENNTTCALTKEDTDYQEMMGYAQWVYRASKDLEPEALVVTRTASMALERKDFRSAAKAFRTAFYHSRSSNLTESVSESDTFTPYEMILLELLLYAEVQ